MTRRTGSVDLRCSGAGWERWAGEGGCVRRTRDPSGHLDQTTGWPCGGAVVEGQSGGLGGVGRRLWGAGKSRGGRMRRSGEGWRGWGLVVLGRNDRHHHHPLPPRTRRWLRACGAEQEGAGLRCVPTGRPPSDAWAFVQLIRWVAQGWHGGHVKRTMHACKGCQTHPLSKVKHRHTYY